MGLTRYQISPGMIAVPHGLYIEEMGALAIADLHIGYEESLAQSGVHLPRSQHKRIKNRITRLLDELEPKSLVIVGDVKHEFGGATKQEWVEVLDLLDAISDRVELHVVRGNHDNFLIPILRKRGVELWDPHLKMEDHLFAHGHRKLAEAIIRGKKSVVLGHEHPAITYRNGVGARQKFKCHLVGELDGAVLIVLPAISPLILGTDVLTRSEPLSPILAEVGLGSLRVIVVDERAGAYDFGKLNRLRILQESSSGYRDSF